MVLRCPICGAVTTWAGNPTRPFCSEACQMRDLGNWLTERYSLPTSEPPTPDTESPESPLQDD